MTSEERRAHNARLKAIRAKARRAAAKAREEARRAERDRITALRLKGTELDKHAKEANAAVGKKAIAKQRARQKKELKAAKALAEKEAKKAKELAKKEREELKDNRPPPGANGPQEPKTIEGVPGSVVGRISTTKFDELSAIISAINAANIQIALYWTSLTNISNVQFGDSSRFEDTEFEELGPAVDALNSELAAMDPHINALGAATGAIDLGGMFGIFAKGKRG